MSYNSSDNNIMDNINNYNHNSGLNDCQLQNPYNNNNNNNNYNYSKTTEKMGV